MLFLFSSAVNITANYCANHVYSTEIDSEGLLHLYRYIQWVYHVHEANVKITHYLIQNVVLGYKRPEKFLRGYFLENSSLQFLHLPFLCRHCAIKHMFQDFHLS